MKTSMKVNSYSLSKLRQKLDVIPPKVEDAARENVDTARVRIHGDALTAVPFDEGDLMESLKSETSESGLRARVGSNLLYAPFVEFGTNDTPAQSYLFPAAEQERRKFGSRMRYLVKKALRDAARGA